MFCAYLFNGEPCFSGVLKMFSIGLYLKVLSFSSSLKFIQQIYTIYNIIYYTVIIVSVYILINTALLKKSFNSHQKSFLNYWSKFLTGNFNFGV